MPFHYFVNGEVLDADQINTYLMQQVPVSVATLTERDAISPKTWGQLVQVQGENNIYRWDGAQWNLWRPADVVQSYRFADVNAANAAVGIRSGDFSWRADTSTRYRHNGTTWQTWDTNWAAWTPTWSNFTAGNGTNASTWRMRDGQAEVVISFTLGTTSAVTGSIICSLPVNAFDNGTFYGQGHLYDGTRIYAIYPYLNSTTQFRFRYLQVAGTTLQYSDATATAPFTFANGHQLQAKLTYRVY